MNVGGPLVKVKEVLLNERQHRIIAEYIKGGCKNGTQAALAAGVPESNARQVASQLLSRPAVKKLLKHYVEDSMEGLLKKASSAEAILHETAKIAFQDPRNMFDEETGRLLKPHELSDKAAGSIAGIETASDKDGTTFTKVKTYDKIAALKLLGTHVGVYVDKKEIKITLGLAKDMSRIRAERLKRERVQQEEQKAIPAEFTEVSK